MHIKNQLRRFSLFFFLSSILLRLSYNVFVFVAHSKLQAEGNTGIFVVVHLTASILSIGLAYLALRAFWKAVPSGSNAGCLYLIFMLLNFIAAFISLLYAFGDLFANSDSIGKVHWFS